MQLTVEAMTSPHGDLEPRAFYLGRRHIAVCDIVDRWLAPEYGYYKVAGNDGAFYILRHDRVWQTWELTLFQVQ